MSEITDLIRRLTLLEQRLDNLVEPEVGRWVDISANVSLYQNAAVAATINYAMAFVENDKVSVGVRLTATAAGAITNDILVLLPLALAPAFATGVAPTLGTGIYDENGVGGTAHSGTMLYVTDIGGLPAFGLKVDTVTTEGDFLGVVPNIAIVSGDIFFFEITYER